MCVLLAAVGGKQWRIGSVSFSTCVWRHCVFGKLNRISNREANAKITPVEEVILTNVVDIETFCLVSLLLNH
jgi:hypothetical protein